MKKKGGGLVLVLVLAVMVVILCRVGAADQADELVNNCSEDLSKLIVCLDFVTGKANAPNPGCCDSIKGIKDGKPQCLCFFIQQTHEGSKPIKDMGIQEPKLLQLPSVCNLKNSNVSYCPKLLGIPPNSPGAAIFNSSFPTTPAATTTTMTKSPSGNSGIKMAPRFPTGLMAMAIAIYCISSFFFGL